MAKRAKKALRQPPAVAGDAPPTKSWLWFRHSPGSRLIALEEFKDLPTEGQAGLAKAVERYKTGQSRRHDVKALGGGIFELRHRHGNNHFRVLFFMWGSFCVGLTAFCKNQQTTPKPDVDRAKARARRWREVFGPSPPTT